MGSNLAQELTGESGLVWSFRACDVDGIQVLPVVAEALRGWHRNAAPVVSKFTRQMVINASKEKGQIRHLSQSLHPMGGNAVLILNRTPVNAVVDGYQDLRIVKERVSSNISTL